MEYRGELGQVDVKLVDVVVVLVDAAEGRLDAEGRLLDDRLLVFDPRSDLEPVASTTGSATMLNSLYSFSLLACAVRGTRNAERLTGL